MTDDGHDCCDGCIRNGASYCSSYVGPNYGTRRPRILFVGYDHGDPTVTAPLARTVLGMFWEHIGRSVGAGISITRAVPGWLASSSLCAAGRNAKRNANMLALSMRPNATAP